MTDGSVAQEKWDNGVELLHEVCAQEQVRVLRRSEHTTGSHVDAPFWPYVRDTVLVAPFRTSPHVHRTSIPGAILIPDPPAHYLISAESLSTLAHFTCTHIERAYLRHYNAAQDVHYNVVRAISNSLTSSLELEEVLDTVANPIRNLLDVETVSIGLIDPNSGDITFVKVLMGPLFDALPPIRVARGEGVVGWVVEHNEPIIINNAYEDKRFYAEVDEQSGFRTKSIACVPLRASSEVIGVIEAINKQSGDFTLADQHLLEAIASPLAIALRNAGLHLETISEKRRIETIFSNMSEGVLTMDASGRITDVNRALSRLLGVSIADLRGVWAAEAISARRDEFVDFITAFIDDGEERGAIACDITAGKDDYIPVLISGVVAQTPDQRLDEIILVFSDLRTIREVERMRDDFFHNIVHELRTPLATILMYARLLREGRYKEDLQKHDRWLAIIEEESDRLQMMVRQMLSIAKREARRDENAAAPVNVKRLLTMLISSQLEAASERDIHLESNIAPDLPLIQGFEEDMYTLFKNLVDNAIKFTQNGSVLITAWIADEGHIAVSVADDGIGIPAEAQANLFKRFYRAQTAVDLGIGGTGLGLYLINDIAKRHHGTVEVVSKVDEGSTFTVRLPIDGPPTAEPPTDDPV